MTEKKLEDGNWLKKHWLLASILFIISFIIFISIIINLFNSDKNTSNTSDGRLRLMGKDEELVSSSSNNVQTSSGSSSKIKGIEEVDLYELEGLFCSYNSPYTNLQKEEEFKRYKDKWIETSVIVDEIYEGWLGGLYVTALTPDITIYFKESEKDKLLKINKYDEISFTGRIDRYSILGISLEDAELK